MFQLYITKTTHLRKAKCNLQNCSCKKREQSGDLIKHVQFKNLKRVLLPAKHNITITISHTYD
jgi:hypothetical protein